MRPAKEILSPLTNSCRAKAEFLNLCVVNFSFDFNWHLFLLDERNLWSVNLLCSCVKLHSIHL